MTYFACSRGGSTDSGNRKVRVTIPLEWEAAPGGFQAGAQMINQADREPFYAETDRAYGLKLNGQMVWVPKSQVQDFNCERAAEVLPRIEFWAPLWLVEAKSLEIFVDTSHEPGLFQEQS